MKVGNLFDTIITHVAIHFVNGNVFFLGVGILISASAASIFLGNSSWSFLSRIGVSMGIILIGLSSTPLPIWFYCIWGIPALGMLFDWRAKLEDPLRCKHWIPITLIVLSVIAALVELPYHIKPAVSIDRAKKVFVIGDSISAGIGNENELWPAILQRQIGTEVVNLSEPGLKVADAVEMARKLGEMEPGSTMVILEIGGNDILGKTDAEAFKIHLDRILSIVSTRSDTLIVLELPLPPFCNKYGRIQRELAKKYKARLIPKRFFARIITRGEATVDGLHLSPTGHRMFAGMMGEIFALSSPRK